MIKITDLSVKYYSQGKENLVLDNINMSLDAGSISVIIGPSGCGKSTILKSLAGIIGNYEGNILIAGKGIKPRNHRIGFIPQNYGLLSWKNVYDNVTLALRVKDKKGEKDEEYIHHILKSLGLHGLEARYPKELSGGQLQRVAIARSFILKPDLLLMDEPFSALDAITREEIQNVFLDIWKKHKVTTVLVTHSVEEAVYLGTKIFVLSKLPGKIIRTISNPLFNTEDLRYQEDYLRLSSEIRESIKEDWSNER